MTRVSIVIPAYNNEQYLAATLDSVLNQTYSDYEVVVADHSSTDGTAAVLERYRDRPRMRILEATPAGGGAQRNWNRVSQAASGELVKLVCGDDLVSPELLSRQVAAFERYPSLSLSSCRRAMVDAQGHTIMKSRGVPDSLNGLHPCAKAIRTAVRQGTNIFGEPACIMMRRSLLESIGWWDNTNPYVIDQRTYTQVLLAGAEQGGGDFFGVNEVLAAFRISASQWSVRSANSQAQQVADFHGDLATNHPDVVRPIDARIGNAMARANAFGRRLVYVLLGARRMNASTVVESTT